jgi:MFS family permease
MPSAKTSIYSVSFVLLCASTLLFSASFNMMIPELPAYLTAMGGGEYIGLIIALFTVTAGLSRPFSGKLTDKIGRIPVMAIGSIVCFLCGFLYPIMTSISGFLFLRLLHGFSTGFKPTATAAYIADIIPKDRWGEAIGFHGLCFSIGQAIGPAIGSGLVMAFDIQVMFYVSSAFALLSIVILMRMKETLKNKERFQMTMLIIKKDEIIDRNVLPSAIVVLITYLSYGAILTLIPAWTQHVGIQNKGYFFIVFTLSSVIIRLVAGKASDKYGRTVIINIGLVGLITSLILLALVTSTLSFTAASMMYGISLGILSPALNAWTIDLSHPDHRGKAMATMYIALEIGIGLGALLSGWYFKEQISHITHTFITVGLVNVLALLIVVKFVKKSKNIA